MICRICCEDKSGDAFTEPRYVHAVVYGHVEVCIECNLLSHKERQTKREKCVELFKLSRKMGYPVESKVPLVKRVKLKRKSKSKKKIKPGPPVLAEKTFWQSLTPKGKRSHLIASRTASEIKFCEYLTAAGIKHSIQHRIGCYYADIALLNDMIVIEIDGSVHDNPEARKYDAKRTKEMERLGWQIIRFTNQQVASEAVRAITEVKNFQMDCQYRRTMLRSS